MGTHMKTTIELSDALLEAAKRLAQSRGTTLRAVVEEGLRLPWNVRRIEPVAPTQPASSPYACPCCGSPYCDGTMCPGRHPQNRLAHKMRQKLLWKTGGGSPQPPPYRTQPPGWTLQQRSGHFTRR